MPLRGSPPKKSRGPRVALRPPLGGLRCTRGYSPAPRWGGVVVA